MKRMLLPLLLGTTLVACTKTSTTSTPTTPTTTTTSDPNKVTVVDNGTTYTASGAYPAATNQTPVMVSITKSISSILQVSTGTGSQFLLYFQASGPANALGNYQIDGGGGAIVYTETFSGGQGYSIDSGTANITTASPTNVTGTFTIHLTGGKTITGTINASKPQVQ